MNEARRECSNCGWASSVTLVPPSTLGAQIYCELIKGNRLILSAQECDKYPGVDRSPKYSHAESYSEYIKRKRDSLLSISAFAISLLSLFISFYNAFYKTR